MNNLKKFELMEKIVRQLQDIQHSQQAIIEKVANSINLNDGISIQENQTVSRFFLV